jgi:glycosyltransferase involved in cell wall biosynthesis
LNILFDGVFNTDPKSGVHKYFYNLIKYLPHKYKKFSSTSVSKSDLPNHFIPFLKHFRPHRLSFLLEYLWFTKKCQSTQFNLVHSAFYNLSKPCEYLISNGIPHIITVHDLIHELFEEKKNEIVARRSKILQNAKAIIAVSNNTKTDLLNVYPNISEEKVSVVHHGLNQDDFISRKNYPQKTNFLLYVGHREGYKNFKILLPTLKSLRNKHDIKLIVVGPKPTNEEKKLISNYGLNTFIEFQNEITDKKLNLLYLECLAFVYPTLYEGFGFPLIEAMAKGSIPIASHSSCMPEVLAGAGILVEPNCSNSIADAVYKIIENKEFKKSLESASMNRAKDFSWEKSIRETTTIYESTSIYE